MTIRETKFLQNIFVVIPKLQKVNCKNCKKFFLENAVLYTVYIYTFFYKKPVYKKLPYMVKKYGPKQKNKSILLDLHIDKTTLSPFLDLQNIFSAVQISNVCCIMFQYLNLNSYKFKFLHLSFKFANKKPKAQAIA